MAEWPKRRTLTAANAGADVEQQEPSFISGTGELQQPLWKVVLWFLTKLNSFLP